MEEVRAVVVTESVYHLMVAPDDAVAIKLATVGLKHWPKYWLVVLGIDGLVVTVT